jgi:hypothetical protein
MCDRSESFFQMCTSEDKNAQKRVWLVCEASLILGGCQSDWGVINSIRADPHGFTGAYRSIEKDTVAYESEMWAHTHDAWVQKRV